jgi:glucose-1-phosphate adenylyltransferase
MLPPSKISGTTLEKTIVAEGCIILASRVENSVLGIRTRIGSGTTIVSSYIMGNDFYESLEDMARATKSGIPIVGIGHRCYVQNAIIDKDCRIGNDVRIVGGSHLNNIDTPLYTVKDGIVVVKKGAILPNGYVIG